MRIGLISDTHGYFDPQVSECFRGVDHILHAGDIGFHSIILALEDIAPVTAVLGNTDMDLPHRDMEVLQLGTRKFLLHHIVDPYRPAEVLRRHLTRETPDVVVFGHTHKPFAETLGSTVYINPGYAGKKRYNLRRSLAILTCSPSSVVPEFHDL